MVTKTRSKKESSVPAEGDLRWSVERRLAFIEERLFWIGSVNRTDLVRRFAVSMSQASMDIARYLAHEAPGIHYDKSGKRYVADAKFRLVLAKPDAGRFLGELRLVDLGILSADQTSLGAGAVPEFDATPVPQRSVDPFVLRAILRAIRERQALDIHYQSLSRPEPVRRTIEPHALAYDGFRWHARAFDRETGEFRDFVLGRVSKPKAGSEAASKPADDADWNCFVELVIAPHPKLTPAQARAIAIDYGIRGDSTSIRVRRALLFYALKRLGLDVSPEARSPTEQHIVLVNRDQIQPHLTRRSET
jgi:hypothetical protein